MTVLLMGPYRRFIHFHITFDSPNILRIDIIFRMSTNPTGCTTPSTTRTVRKELRAFNYLGNRQGRLRVTLQPTYRAV